MPMLGLFIASYRIGGPLVFLPLVTGHEAAVRQLAFFFVRVKFRFHFKLNYNKFLESIIKFQLWAASILPSSDIRLMVIG